MFKKAVILNDTSIESHHGCEIVMSSIKKLLLINNIKTIDTNPAGVNCFNNKSFMDSMLISDIVIINGEGTLHHNQSRALELINVVKYVKEQLKIPSVLINSTYQENGSKIAEIMKFFDLIFVRESLSQKELKRYNIDSKVVPDITFYKSYDDIKKSIDREGIGFTDSVYLDKSKVLYDLSIKNNYYYLPILTSKKLTGFFGRIEQILRICLKLVRFFLWKLGFNFNHSIVRTFYYTNTYYNYINRISKLNFALIGRYHSLCFALKTFTSFYAIPSNSHKIEGLLDDIGISHESRLIDIANINLPFNSLNEKEVEKIKVYVNGAPLRIENMFLSIKKLLIDYDNNL